MIKRPWFILALVLILSIFVVAACSSGGGQEDEQPKDNGSQEQAAGTNEPKQEPVKISIATLDVGSGYYSYGNVFAEVIRKELPEGSTVDVLPYGGTVGNVDLVATGEADLGLSSPFVINWATKGILAYEGKQYDNIRVLVAGLDQYFFGAIAREDAPFETLKDIADKKLKVKLATQPNRTLGDYGGQLVLNAYGLSYEMIKEFGGKAEHTSGQVVGDDMRDGRVDFSLDFFNLGHPEVTEIATMTPIRFLPVEPEIAQKLHDDYGFEKVTLPAGSFPGQDEDVPMVGGPTALFASAEMPDEVAYAITKAMVENSDYLKDNLAALKDFTSERAVQMSGGLPFHRGAIKYYKEKGLMN